MRGNAAKIRTQMEASVMTLTVFNAVRVEANLLLLQLQLGHHRLRAGDSHNWLRYRWPTPGTLACHTHLTPSPGILGKRLRAGEMADLV
jgi:hypothetical protein